MGEVIEPLRDRIGRALYEEPGRDLDWYSLNEERREPWRIDADRVLLVVTKDDLRALESTLIQSVGHTIEVTDKCCPLCGGDCGSANPPIINCPMKEDFLSEPAWCGWCGGTCKCDKNDD